MSNKNFVTGLSKVETHRQLLVALCGYTAPLEDLEMALAPFGWDHEEELVELTRQSLRRLIVNWTEGTLSGADLAAWADTVESREDIGREAPYEETLNEILFELSSPSINGDLSQERAKELLQIIG